MSYFPLFIDLTGAAVLLIGNGPQIADKRERLSNFQAELYQLDSLSEKDLSSAPAMVVIGDLPFDDAERYSQLCRKNRIPVNVVDVPSLCTFYFPALISRGDLTVGISTGGKSPGFASCLRKKLEEYIPQRSGEILDWLHKLRPTLKNQVPAELFRSNLRKITEQSLNLGRPLSEKEINHITGQQNERKL